MKTRGKLQKEVAFNLELGNSMNAEKRAFLVAAPMSAKGRFFPKEEFRGCCATAYSKRARRAKSGREG